MRRQVYKVILSIVLFVIVYLILVAAAGILAIIFCWIGVRLIMSLTNFLGLLLGLGLIAAGVSVFIFLVKFIFSVTKDENSLRVEVTEEQQPRLFAFIRELTTAT